MQIIMFIVMIDFSRLGSRNTLQISYMLLKSLGKEIMTLKSTECKKTSLSWTAGKCLSITLREVLYMGQRQYCDGMTYGNHSASSTLIGAFNESAQAEPIASYPSA